MSEAVFVTKCWQGDYEKILNIDRLRRMYFGNNHNFKRFKIWLNNFINEEEYQKANRMFDDLISQYSSELPLEKLRVRDYQDRYPEARDYFHGFAYHLSICEYLTMQLETGPVLYTCGDILVHSTFDWVELAVKILDTDLSILAVAPGNNWGNDWAGIIGKDNEVRILGNHPYRFEYGYSDQCNIYYPERLKKVTFNETHPEVGGGPQYWFEVHLNAWTKNHHVPRVTLGGDNTIGFAWHSHDSVN